MLGLDLSPALWIGATLALLHILGTIPVFRLRFTTWVKGSMMHGVASLRIYRGISSNTALTLDSDLTYVRISLLFTSLNS